MDVLFYRGYEMQAAPNQLADSGEWTTEVLIFVLGEKSRHFSAGKIFATRPEAVAHCLELEKQEVDRKLDSGGGDKAQK